ncbi:MAG TPA: SRPBCC family protein [Thermoanaerobaculia bacterium]|jgi:uncharacterized membrane protein|nr:SRPBCC family protein [Thermoanaerobaculia bacterium]
MSEATSQPIPAPSPDLGPAALSTAPLAKTIVPSTALDERLESTPRDAGIAGRVAAFAGAGALLGAAARKRSPVALAAAAAAALPLVYRGTTGRWPLPGKLTASPVIVKTRLVVWRPAPQVYEAWRAFDRLPAILRHVDAVQVIDERRSHWSVRAPGGKHVEWDAEITDDRPGEVLAWRSLEGAPVQQLGSLHFDAWRDGGTLMRVDLRLLPPAGAAGTAVAALLQPLVEREIHEDLRRFKHALEAGEVPTTEGQSHGERGRFDLGNPL